jgi:hypothetical protein
MIRYALVCENVHAFEAWFSGSADYDDQSARGLVECPWCHSRKVEKQIMAPAVAGTKAQKSGAESPDAEMQTVMMEAMGKLRRHVEENFESVGDRFADEARAIHEGEAPDRGIYGRASPEQVRELAEEGIRVGALPPAAVPAPKDKLN